MTKIMKLNNKGYLKISVLPLFILIAVGIAVYFLFLSDTDLVNFSNEPKIRRLNGFPTTAYTKRDDLEKQRLVITNQQQLNEFLNTVDESGYLIVREDIDFDKEFILAVSTDVNEREGHQLKIRKLYQDKDTNTLLVSLRETEPGETCEVELNKNVAVDMVAISKTELKIDFERIKEISECD